MQGRMCAKDRRVCKGEVCAKKKVWERVVQGRGVSSRLSTFDNSDLLLLLSSMWELYRSLFQWVLERYTLTHSDTLNVTL